MAAAPTAAATTLGLEKCFFYAVLGGELLACLSYWPLKRNSKHWRKVVVADMFTIVPAERIVQSVVFTPTVVGQQSTVLMPARLHQTHDPSA